MGGAARRAAARRPLQCATLRYATAPQPFQHLLRAKRHVALPPDRSVIAAQQRRQRAAYAARRRRARCAARASTARYGATRASYAADDPRGGASAMLMKRASGC
jgi:hypothetical protein